MDPFIGGALISGVGSLLGGLFGQSSAAADRRFNAEQIDKQNEYNKPINIRKRAEEGGFNPLSFIGPGVGLQTGVAQANSGNYMGAAIADAGMAFAGAMADKAKFQETKKLNDLEMANAKLQNKILQLTLRPKVGGVYAQRETTPTIAAAVGGGNVSRNDLSYRLADPVQLVAGAAGGIAVPDARLDRGSGVYVAGNRIEGAPGWSPSSVFENEYGDVGQAFYGLGKLAADVAYTHETRQREYRLGHTVGETLKVPFGWPNRAVELLPPLPRFKPSERSKHPPKSKGYQKNIYDNRSLFTQWGVY